MNRSLIYMSRNWHSAVLLHSFVTVVERLIFLFALTLPINYLNRALIC